MTQADYVTAGLKAQHAALMSAPSISDAVLALRAQLMTQWATELAQERGYPVGARLSLTLRDLGSRMRFEATRGMRIAQGRSREFTVQAEVVAVEAHEERAQVTLRWNGRTHFMTLGLQGLPTVGGELTVVNAAPA